MTLQSPYYLLLVVLLWLAAQCFRAPKERQVLLLVASYGFYSSWGLDPLAILIASSFINYACGISLRRKPTPTRLWIGLVVNLFFLGFYKYLPPLAGAESLSAHGNFLHRIVMPIGISFWTFQAMSYLFDLYRGVSLDPSLPEFCLYMAFWPTVLSGPVCRLREMLPQFRHIPGMRWSDLTVGARRIAVGLFFKLVLAQTLASVVSPADRGSIIPSSGIDVWVLAVGFGLQLYFDFAGYSHIAIGSARLFGFALRENFEDPYLAPTPSAFWNRWHMSLSFWIRDYVFLPLATLRRESWWRHVSLMASMTLFGLWHGGSLPFILWGTYQGIVLAIHRLGQRFWVKIAWPLGLGEFLPWALTFASISLGWVFFQARTLSQIAGMLASALQPVGFLRLSLSRNSYLIVTIVAMGYFAFAGIRSWILRAAWWRRELSADFTPARVGFGGGVVIFSLENRWWFFAPGIITLAALLTLVLSGGHYTASPFIYTHF